ncbi:AMP-binding protein [Effusibacillus dendaii]|uniref:AMP-dependent synthetase/ligase domain-containing protein n=1 Tax=Effusibacillus dendaii TaxID=2743772 RepID=A0A7I8D8L9_9BACL|nr:AMP-binding protein [Effusibacillus dendaii]BCJ86347.1 hypothetical protein skT53_13320 [Effusibacillus dendaii]
MLVYGIQPGEKVAILSTNWPQWAISDFALSYLPLSHIFERTVGQFATLASGAAIAYAESIEQIQQNLKEVRLTVLCTVPRQLEKVYSAVNQKVSRMPKCMQNSRLLQRSIQKKIRSGLSGRIRLVVSGGAGLAEEIAEFFNKSGVPVYEGYGMTESAPVICANPLGEARPGTVGRPIPGVEVKLAEDGELLVKGPNVTQGYYRAPEATAELFTPDGWLQTEDIAAIHDGYVSIVIGKRIFSYWQPVKILPHGPSKTKLHSAPISQKRC